MPSPFPGMNPYLEQPDAWQTFHSNYLTELQRQIRRKLPPGYFVKTEVSVILHEPSAAERRQPPRADVAVGRDGSARGGGGGAAATVAPAALHTILPGVLEDKIYTGEIRDRKTRRLVTVIEHLSPANKPGGGNFAAYGQKRQRLVNEGVNLVEIDLLRKGGRMPLGEEPPGDYCVTVARAAEAPAADVWPFSLRDPLPVVPVPLDPGVDDVPLDLREALDAVYDEMGYADWLYDGGLNEVSPQLSADDAAWAEAAAGRLPS